MSLDSLNEGAAPGKNDLLTMAVYEKNAAAVNFLLKHGADPNARYLGDFDGVDKRSRFSVDDLRTNLHDALHHYGSRSSCNSFCKKPVPLIPASMDRIDPLFRRSVPKLEWPTVEESPSAMHLAACNGRLEILKALIAHGGDVDVRMEHSYTPLIIAILRKKYDAAVVLIEHGADLNAQTKSGKSALYYAVKTKKLKLVRLLVNSGVDVNAKTRHGVTALHIACELRLQEVASLLVKSGAELNAKTNTGVTPLHCCVVQGQIQMTEMILNHGGDVTSIMSSGKIDVTPLLFVTEVEKRKIACLLEKHAPKVAPITPTGIAKKLVKKLIKSIPWAKKFGAKIVC